MQKAHAYARAFRIILGMKFQIVERWKESSNKANAFIKYVCKPIIRIATAKVQQNLRICKKNRILVRFFTRRVIAEHKTSGG